MTKNLWVIMVINCIFLKKFQCFNCNNFNSICPFVNVWKLNVCQKSVKIDKSLFQKKKKNRTENVKMLLQNNCINNGVTNGLKQQKQIACETALYGKIKERRERRRVDD